MLFSLETFGQSTSTDSIFNRIITPDDLKIILGKWTGSLTYIDYSSNKPYTMPADVEVKRGKNEKQLLLITTYPNEPNANSKDKIRISQNGQLLNKKALISKEKLTNGEIQVTTEYLGKDNKKEALIRDIYLLGNNQFIIRKEVKFKNSQDWIKRNEYKFKR